MALSPWWLFNTALGNSEGLLAAAVLWAVVAHLAGRRRAALALLTAAALMRPEVWPFLGAYGVWLWRRDPADRRAVILAGASIPLLWFGPDVLGAGGALDASKTARGVPSPGSAKLASIPALALLGDTATLFTLPALVAALLAAVVGGPHRAAARGGRRGVGGDRGGDDGRGLRGQPALPRRGRRGRRRARGSGSVGARPRRRPVASRAPPARGRDAAAPLAARSAPPCSSPPSSPSRPATCATSRPSSPRAPRPPAPSTARSPPPAGATRCVRCSRIRTSNRARSLVAWRLDLPMRDLDARARPPRGRDPREVVLRPGPRAAASTPATETLVTTPVLADRRRLRPARPQVEPGHP